MTRSDSPAPLMQALRLPPAESPMQVLVVIEDDPDVQFLIESVFSMDSRFCAADVAESAEVALEWSAQTTKPGVIVLDQGLSGSLSGLDAARRLKEVAPFTKIILFTAHAELQARAEQEPAVDAFLLKTDAVRLLPLAQRLTGLTELGLTARIDRAGVDRPP